jgi:tetratricopeptide (TPR) repeat protein
VKKTGLALAAALLLAGGRLFAQSEAGNVHYVFSGDSRARELLLKELEARFTVYNRLFRFDESKAALPLRVRLIDNEQAYADYVGSRLGSDRPGAVYLHYASPERRELVIHTAGEETARHIPHQAFIQFLRAFVSNPPAWMREGFAVYFSGLRAGENGELSYEENLAWLDTVKALGNRMPQAEAILRADSGTVPENFQASAWALVSFFLNSGMEEYFRTMIESFMILDNSKSAAENGEAVYARISAWSPQPALAADFASYLASRRTFAELVNEGTKAYSSGDPFTAELAFMAALDQKPAQHIPYYYLGLIAYDERNYNLAEQYYRSSLEYGADKALISYALGLNAIAAGRNSEAVVFLQDAAAASPERYRDRVETLLERIK